MRSPRASTKLTTNQRQRLTIESFQWVVLEIFNDYAPRKAVVPSLVDGQKGVRFVMDGLGVVTVMEYSQKQLTTFSCVTVPEDPLTSPVFVGEFVMMGRTIRSAFIDWRMSLPHAQLPGRWAMRLSKLAETFSSLQQVTPYQEIRSAKRINSGLHREGLSPKLTCRFSLALSAYLCSYAELLGDSTPLTDTAAKTSCLYGSPEPDAEELDRFRSDYRRNSPVVTTLANHVNRDIIQKLIEAMICMRSALENKPGLAQ